MTKAELENLQYLDELINRKLLRVHYLKLRALPDAIKYRPETSTATVFDPLGDLFAEIDKEERKAQKLIDQYARERRRAINAISQLPTRKERNILYLRYLAFMRWDDVEKAINIKDKCSRRTMLRIHNRALEKIR